MKYLSMNKEYQILSRQSQIPKMNSLFLIKRKLILIIPYRQFYIEKYDSICEEHAKIERIITLGYSPGKIFLFILCNLITGFLINLFLVWFPKLKMIFIYKIVPLSDAKFIGVYGLDKQFYSLDLKTQSIPHVTNRLILLSYLESSTNVYSFTFKLYTYVFNYKTNAFVAVHFDLDLTQEEVYSKMIKGLNDDEVRYQRNLYGECNLNIEIKSVFHLLFIEFSDPFYLFQVFSVCLWFNNEYEVYAGFILFTTIVSLLLGLYETKSNLKEVQKLARYSIPVKIYKKNSIHERVTNASEMDSEVLVPGDIFEVPGEGLALPCDCLLLTGSVIVNESMLTGESTPIIKAHMPHTEKKFNLKADKKYFLFAGTKIVQKRSQGNEAVLAMVMSTGFNTVKGNLVRSILYPKETDSNFKKDSVKYILLMGVLCIIGFSISLPFMLQKSENPTKVFLKALDLITTTVPPSLPACLGIGISSALSRLKKKNIFCISRGKINVAGKIEMVVFDKTGTLTEDHLDIAGFLALKTTNNNETVFDGFEKTAENMSKKAFEYFKQKAQKKGKEKKRELKQLYVECLGTCHGITLVNSKLIGDPIDVKMFESIEWNLKEIGEVKENVYENSAITAYVRPKEEQSLAEKVKMNKDNDRELFNDENKEILSQHYEIGIVRRFDFSSKLQRMSVIAQSLNNGEFKIFSKGSPEKIKDLCQRETLPIDFNEQLTRYTSKGYRVLALAGKLLKMEYHQSQEISRSGVESNLVFLGLLIVQNKLKEATPDSIKTLDNANIKMVMATGDNILTAIAVSKDCFLVNSHATCYSCEFSERKNQSGHKDLTWNTIENFKEIDDEGNIQEGGLNESLTLFEISPLSNNDVDINDIKELTGLYPDSILPDFKMSVNYGENSRQITTIANQSSSKNKISIDLNKMPFDEKTNKEGITIAITGPTFEIMHRYNNRYNSDPDGKTKYQKFHDIFRLILKYCVIYARMSPEHKTMLVEALKKESFTVMMCGDGANDCGALRAADVGLSLSREEASIAAHFTSNIPDISSVVLLLREGKASLVTSIQTFKYMMVYSLIQFICVTIMNIVGTYLTDWQFLSVDLFIIFPLAFLLGRTGAYPELTHQRPNAELISFPIIISILLQTMISFTFQFGGYELMVKFFKVSDDKCIIEPKPLGCIENAVYILSHITI